MRAAAWRGRGARGGLIFCYPPDVPALHPCQNPKHATKAKDAKTLAQIIVVDTPPLCLLSK